MDASGGAQALAERVREYALAVARARGWSVEAADCAVASIASPLGGRPTNGVLYWQVNIRLRAALNRQRSLAKDVSLIGTVRAGDDGSLMDTLTESLNTLEARLQAEGER